MPLVLLPSSQLLWVRVAALVFSCVAFSVSAHGAMLPHGGMADWCIFCWAFSFAGTLLVLLVEQFGLQARTPVSWTNFPITLACYAALLCLSASVIYPLYFLQGGSWRGEPRDCRIAATVFSCLATVAYLGEVSLARARPGEVAGYMATAPGLLKVCQTSVACLIFILVSDPVAYDGHAALKWCMAVYCICFILSAAVVVLCVGECSRDRTIVLLGKTGAGKSSTGNTIFGGEEVFHTSSSSNSLTEKCKPESRIVEGRHVTLIDTPGFFDTRISDDEQRKEIINCMTESAGGVHAFLIVLKVEKFTVHEKEIITKIQQSFSNEAFKYATVLFTHGYQLKGKPLQDYVLENKEVSQLVKKCGGRCHVIDNEHWNQGQQDRKSINQFQVSELLKTIDQMVEQNGGGSYTNEILQAVQEELQAEMMLVREESGGKLSDEEIHRQIKKTVKTKLSVRLAGIATGVLVGGVFGVTTAALLPLYIITVVAKELRSTAKEIGSTAEAFQAIGFVVEGGGTAASGGGTEAAAGTWLSTAAKGILSPAKYMVGTGAVLGGIGGGIIGADAAEGAETAGEAAVAAATAVYDKSTAALGKVKDWVQEYNKEKSL